MAVYLSKSYLSKVLPVQSPRSRPDAAKRTERSPHPDRPRHPLPEPGRGPLCGKLVRNFWARVLPAGEFPGNDSPPVRVKLLSERLLAFRDSEGRLGLIDEFCAHRGVSLWFGRNEEAGLRCPY